MAESVIRDPSRELHCRFGTVGSGGDMPWQSNSFPRRERTNFNLRQLIFQKLICEGLAIFIQYSLNHNIDQNDIANRLIPVKDEISSAANLRPK